MKTKFCSLIVLSSTDSRVWKIHITRPAMAILLIAFILSFLITVAALTYSFPSEKLSDADHARLRAENKALQTETKNVQVGTRKIDAGLSRLEELSKRIGTLVEID